MKKRIPELCTAALGAMCLLAGMAVFTAGGRPMLFGALALAGIGCVLLVLALSFHFGGKAGRRLRRVLLGVVAAGVLAFGALEGVVLCGAQSTLSDTEPDAVVILGAAVWDGEPSPVLKRRISAGAAWLAEHPDVPVVVTGGVDTGETVSEAAVMAAALEDYGIDPDRIYLEEQATNTLENLTCSIALLEEAGLPAEHLLVVSSAPHLARVRLLAGRCGVNADCLAASVPGGIEYRAYLYLREAAALVKSFFVDFPLSSG
ncbi:MAG: YdcF family protein [Clostridiales bacterium]|nr:YdcF family protein [Clostridiales bacterium]